MRPAIDSLVPMMDLASENERDPNGSTFGFGFGESNADMDGRYVCSKLLSTYFSFELSERLFFISLYLFY